MAKMGRPLKEFNVKQFVDLVGLGCTQEEICWFFRDESGKPANIDTLTRWCKRTFGVTFQEYSKQNSLMAMKIKLRQIQFKLADKSTAMAIFLGKQYLGQTDKIETEITTMDDSAAQEIEVMLNAASDEVAST